MSYAPSLTYLCPDLGCCDNGCPVVTCKYCHKDWPCADYIDAHTPTQVEAQYRYVDRKRHDGDEDMVKWLANRRIGDTQ